MQKKTVSILLAICMLVSFLPTGMLASAAGITLDTDAVYLAPGATQTLLADSTVTEWSTNNEDVAIVDEEGTVTAVGAGTAIITATGDAGTANAYVAVDSDIHFSYRFDKAYIGKSGTYVTTDWYPLEDVTYGHTQTGHPDEIGSYSEIPSDPWCFNELENWSYQLIHSASAAYGEKWGRGYGIWGKPSGGSNSAGSFSIRIKLPIDGNFVPSIKSFKGNSYGYADFYLAPVNAADPTSSEYFLGNVNLNGSGANNVDTFSALDLTAGEYIVTAKNDVAYASGTTGTNLMIWTSFDLTNTDVTSLKDDTVFLAPGETQTLVATAPESADDKTITYTSNNEEIAIVDEDGTVTAVSAGSTTITATSAAGDSATAYVTVTASKDLTYTFSKAGKSASAWVPFEDITYGNTFAGHADELTAYNAAATDPWAFYSMDGAWKYDTVVSSIASSYSVWGNGGEGNFAIKIKVPADGTYTPTVVHIKGSGYGIGAYYLAPIDAENPWAEEYFIGDVSFAGVAGQNATAGHEATLEPVELTAGEYIIGVTHPSDYPDHKMVLMGWTAFKLKDETAVTLNFPNYMMAMQPGDADVLMAEVLPTDLEDPSVTYTSSNEDVVLVLDDMIMAMEEGTAIVTATSNADPNATDSMLVYVGPKNFYYNYMKFADFGTGESDSTWFKNTANDYELTTSGDPNCIGNTKSFGWKTGMTLNTTREWVWSSSAKSLGAYFAASTGGYAAMDLFVPAAGTYTVSSIHSVWTAGDNLEAFFAPKDAVDPFASKYQLATTNHKASSNYEVEEILGEVIIEEPGEYQIIYRSPNAKGYFIKGLKLSDAEQVIPVESIALSQYGTILMNAGDTLDITATMLPATADDLTYTLSSDSDAVTVSGNTITAVKSGVATITATANDGEGATDSFKVWVNAPSASYVYDFYNPLKAIFESNGNKEIDVDLTEFANSYAPSVEAGSSPWMYDDSNMAATGVKPYFNYTASSNSGFGVFALYVDPGVAGWSRVKINVAADGKYTGMLKFSDWVGSNDFDLYIAPAIAANPVAAEYKVLSFKSSDPSARIALSDMTSEMEMQAGEYYVTFVSTRDDTHLIGIFGLSLYKTGDLAADSTELNPTSVNGAQIRTKGTQGLRFISSIEKSDDFAKVVEYGTILLPSADLSDANDLVIGYENNGHKVAKVPANVLYAEDDTSVSYTAVITNIAAKNYSRAYTARAYVIYEDASGMTRVAYGNTVSRSIYEVAVRGLADETASESDKAVFQAIVDVVENAEA